MTEPRVSVILAVHNVEQYLKQCLDSLIGQTLKDIEIICIDDCSTDNSLNILKEYSLKDSRIKIIEQKTNTRQGIARNNALKTALGEFVIFIDPDDWVELTMLEEMYNKAKEYDCDLVECGNKSYYGKNNKLKTGQPKVQPPQNKPFHWKDFPQYIVGLTPRAAWNKLVRRNLLIDNNILFSKHIPGEDQIFTNKCRFFSKNNFYINKPLYIYRVRQGSDTQKISKDCFNIFNNLKELDNFYNEHSLYDFISDDISCNKMIQSILNYKRCPVSQKNEYDTLCKEILNPKEYKFYNQRKKGLYLKPLEKIFSIKNTWFLGEKYKTVTIMGIRINNKNINLGE